MTRENRQVITGLLIVAVWVVLGLTLIYFSGCARAAGSPRAVTFFADDGAKCYAILNSTDEPVGGNCK